LREIAAGTPDHGELVVTFNAFSNDTHADAMGHFRDGLDDDAAARDVVERADEAAVDLEDVVWHGLQQMQRRIAGAEIIDADANTQPA